MCLTRRRIATGCAVLALGLVDHAAAAQQTYPNTLYWGSGLIDIPVAWVPPLSGDFSLNYSGKSFQRGVQQVKINYNGSWNQRVSFSMAAFGRVEAGVAFYSSNPEYGFFGQGLILDQDMMRDRGGLLAWIPSLALGVRNVGPYNHIDRFQTGYNLLPPTNGSPNYQHVVDPVHQNFNTQNTVYGVATESFALSDIRGGWPNVGLSASLGYGNRLFKDEGGLGSAYAKHSWKGVFGGLKMDFQPARLTTVSLMLENNAWDYNIGAALDYRGLRAGLYLTELGGGSANTSTLQGSLYNYSKFALTLGWQSNIFALLRGDFLRGRVAELERRREGLLAEINARQQRIQALQLEINRIEAQNLLELEQRRAEAEAQLRAEREALQRLEERLRTLEGRNPPPANPPAPQPTPPAKPPLR
jgi:hypothetical protein